MQRVWREIQLNIHTCELNKKLVLLSYDVLSAWETYTQELEDSFGRKFQLELIRIFKGAIKSWRYWLIMLNTETNPGSLPRRPPWVEKRFERREGGMR